MPRGRWGEKRAYGDGHPVELWRRNWARQGAYHLVRDQTAREPLPHTVPLPDPVSLLHPLTPGLLAMPGLIGVGDISDALRFAKKLSAVYRIAAIHPKISTKTKK